MEPDSNTRPLLAELKSAGWSWFAKWAVGILVVYAGVVLLLSVVRFDATDKLVQRVDFEKLGQFGDSFGAMTSLLNALALAALIATVVLQSRELRETRKQLEIQAQATKETAIAAKEQIEQARSLEFMKVRPLLRAEWFNTGDLGAVFRIVNLGFGVAIVYKVEIAFESEIIGEHGEASKELDQAWRTTIGRAVSDKLHVTTVDSVPLTDVNRAVAVGNMSELVRIKAANGVNVVDLVSCLNARIVPVVHFRSLAGESFSTRTQFGLDALVSSPAQLGR